MEGQGHQEFSREPVSSRYALSALRSIEQKSKLNPQSEHPISFLGGIAMSPTILQFLYEHHQGVALELDGSRAIYNVIKDPKDPEHKRLIIQGLGMGNRDIEWLSQYGSPEEKRMISKLAGLTRKDVIRSFRRAIIERYDPYRYKNNLSLLAIVNLGTDVVTERLGAGAGAIGDVVTDTIAARDYRIQRKEERKGISPKEQVLRRERGAKRLKRAARIAAGTLLIGTAVAGAGTYEHEHPGTIGNLVQNVGQRLHHEQKAVDVPEAAKPPPTVESRKVIKVPEDQVNSLVKAVKKHPAVAAGLIGSVAVGGVAALGARELRRKIERDRKKKERKKDEEARRDRQRRGY